jgi:integrase
MISEALAPIWVTKAVTARRTKNRIELICTWVKNGMPMPQKQKAGARVKHHAAMAFADVPAFMLDLGQQQSIAARALEFLILTAARTGEVLGAKWNEIDFDSKVWTVPAGRMKNGKEHAVPLSGHAMELLHNMPRVSDYIFAGTQPGNRLGDKAMIAVLTSMRPGATVHGFRSSFRDWAGDRTSFPKDVIEHALSHTIKDQTEAAYRRATALEKRRKLMEAWGSFCHTAAIIPGSNVTTLAEKRGKVA